MKSTTGSTLVLMLAFALRRRTAKPQPRCRRWCSPLAQAVVLRTGRRLAIPSRLLGRINRRPGPNGAGVSGKTLTRKERILRPS